MQAGLLDRVVELQHRSDGTPNAYGELPVSWSTYATVWGRKLDVRGREYTAMKQVVAEATTRLQIYHRTDVLATDRVVMDGVTYEVLGPPAEIGRGEGLELVLGRVA